MPGEARPGGRRSGRRRTPSASRSWRWRGSGEAKARRRWSASARLLQLLLRGARGERTGGDAHSRTTALRRRRPAWGGCRRADVSRMRAAGAGSRGQGGSGRTRSRRPSSGPRTRRRQRRRTPSSRRCRRRSSRRARSLGLNGTRREGSGSAPTSPRDSLVKGQRTLGAELGWALPQRVLRAGVDWVVGVDVEVADLAPGARVPAHAGQDRRLGVARAARSGVGRVWRGSGRPTQGRAQAGSSVSERQRQGTAAWPPRRTERHDARARALVRALLDRRERLGLDAARVTAEAWWARAGTKTASVAVSRQQREKDTCGQPPPQPETEALTAPGLKRRDERQRVRAVERVGDARRRALADRLEHLLARRVARDGPARERRLAVEALAARAGVVRVWCVTSEQRRARRVSAGSSRQDGGR